MKTQARPPMAVKARKASASVCMFIARSSVVLGHFGGVEGCREPFLFTVIPGAFPETGASDAGRAMPSDDLAVGVLTHQFIDEQILGNDRIAFHAHHLGDVGD